MRPFRCSLNQLQRAACRLSVCLSLNKARHHPSTPSLRSYPPAFVIATSPPSHTNPFRELHRSRIISTISTALDHDTYLIHLELSQGWNPFGPSSLHSSSSAILDCPHQHRHQDEKGAALHRRRRLQARLGALEHQPRQLVPQRCHGLESVRIRTYYSWCCWCFKQLRFQRQPPLAAIPVHASSATITADPLRLQAGLASIFPGLCDAPTHKRIRSAAIF